MIKKIFNRIDNEITYSCFFACLITLVICTIFFAVLTLQLNHKINKNTDELFNTITAYITAATDDEYNAIAEQIRHDLLSHSNTNQLIQYIPNTAEDCPTCQEVYEYQMYLLANNTGELYHIDTERRLTGEQMSLSAGYDEISQTQLSILYDHSCIVNINQKEDIVSLHKMKTIFCDDCIDKILAAIDGQYITSFVIFMPQEQAFYPICEDTEISLENIALEVYFDKENGEMNLVYSW